MVDEIFDRQYQAGRNELHAPLFSTFDRLSETISNTFEVLAKIQFQAPWTTKTKRARCN